MDSKIIKMHMKEEFIKLCEFNSNIKFNLLYRGSRDGFGAHNFHAKCDGKSETVTIIKSSNNNIFGGYTNVAWTKHANIYYPNQNAFLFSLVNKDNEPIKIKIGINMNFISLQGSFDRMSSSNHCGPLFGRFPKYDLIIADNCNLNSNSWSDLSDSFMHPRYGPGSNEAKSFLAGTCQFQVDEIEVFQIGV